MDAARVHVADGAWAPQGVPWGVALGAVVNCCMPPGCQDLKAPWWGIPVGLIVIHRAGGVRGLLIHRDGGVHGFGTCCP